MAFPPESVDTAVGLKEIVDAVQEERAHYSYVSTTIKQILLTMPDIAATEHTRGRLLNLQRQVEGWNKSLRALEVRINLPDS